MKFKVLILIAGFLFIFSSPCIYPQENVVKIDSVQKKKTESQVMKKEQNQTRAREGDQNRVQSQGELSPGQQGSEQNPGNNKSVKQVNSARPDMSKAKGARPPDIVRPSGSGIPKGIGKPGGAMRRGGR